MAQSSPQPQIVALGGVSFGAPADLPLFRYILRLAASERPRVCYIPTASAESPDGIVAFYVSFAALPCQPTHLSLFHLPSADLSGFLLAQDVIFVGGGNTKSMLALWRDWQLDSILREAWQRGIILAGVSAGSICWFERGITDSIPGPLTPLSCLGYLPGSNCPHFDSEPERRPTFHRLLQQGQMPPGYAADDGVGLHYVGDRLHSVVTARPGAQAYHLELVSGAVVETPLAPRLLSAES